MDICANRRVMPPWPRHAGPASWLAFNSRSLEARAMLMFMEAKHLYPKDPKTPNQGGGQARAV